MLLDLGAARNQAAAGTTHQQRDARVQAQVFQDLRRLVEVSRGKKREAKTDGVLAKVPPKPVRPVTQGIVIELPSPMGRNRMLVADHSGINSRFARAVKVAELRALSAA